MKVTGVLAPIPTPFDEKDRIDLVRLRKALRRWLKSSLTGFVVLGSTGEAVLIDDDESSRVIAAARDVVPKKRTFIVGTGRESTRSAVRAAKRAAALGADAVLVRTPGFYKDRMTSEAFVRHYTAVADASPVPVLLYNFTALTGVNLQTDAVARLAKHPNIVGMKESGSDVLQISDLVAATPKDFCVLGGSASTFYTALSLGASGGILALSCVAPEICVRLFALTQAGKHDDARALQQRILPLVKLVGSIHGVPGLKAAAALAGYDVGVPRSPLMPVSEGVVEELREGLAALTSA
ncbi:MAG: dihydrodipicolinate synthase family protein [Vicinamibacterales bacterium]